MSSKRVNPQEDPPTTSSSDEDEVDTSSAEEDDVSSKNPAALKNTVVVLAAPTGKQVSDSDSGSGSGSEEESDEDEVDTSSEEEDDVSSKNPAALKDTVAVLAAPTGKQVSDSDFESGSEEESDSDSEPEKKDQVLTKPVTETKDSAVKNLDSKKVKTSEKSVGKRSRETDEGVSTDVKRVKKGSGEDEKKSGGGKETKKTYFQRVWTEDDEIVVLQGLMDYKNDTGVSPYDDTNGVYQLLKKSISFDVSKVQFMEKLRNLKNKYVGKAKNGVEPTFVKPLDCKAFELSKLVWGANGMALESAVKSNGKSSKKTCKSKKVESVKEALDSSLPNGKNCEDKVTTKGEVSVLGDPSLVKSLARFGVDEFAAQQGLIRIASKDKKRFEEQWKALQVREFEFYSQKSSFIHEVVTKIAEAFRSNI